MRLFKHQQADSLEDAVEFLNAHRGRVKPVGGGTDLLGGLKDAIHPIYPQWLLDIKKIDGLDKIEPTNDNIRIGALSRLVDIENHPAIISRFGLLAQAASSVASPQIRNMGTLAGNICQEPRCWYYRHPDNIFHCLRKGGKACNAFMGDNRYHSIFGAARLGRVSCRSACPAGTNIPAYMELLRNHKVGEAASELLKVNPMPAVTGRVCPHFCQQDCNRHLFDSPVAIRNVERFLGDYILDHTAELMPDPCVESGRRVAVVGSGPAGLSAAYYLRRAGHGITVFERRVEPGGMLTYAIPDYRLPKTVVKRMVASIQASGVEIKTGVHIGAEVTFKGLQSDFDSVFVATGAWGQTPIGLDGEEHAQSGLEFLVSAKKGKVTDIGPKVAVIGGGNVAVDVAITAKRLGATRVTMVCLECREEMPANDHEIEQVLEEGIDIRTSWGPSRIVGSQGKVTGIELVRCTSVFDGECTFAPTFDETCNESIDVDQILLATGQKIDLSYLDQSSGPSFKNGHIEFDSRTQATTVPTVFVGGDAATGPATIIDAVAAGRCAAQSIHKFLGGEEESQENLSSEILVGFSSNCLSFEASAKGIMADVSKRNLTNEDASGLSPEAVFHEASRCLNCGCVATSPSDMAPALIALNAVIQTTRRSVSASDFFSAGIMGSTILELDELVTAVTIPDPGPDSGQIYLKFRLRNAIDFPILGVAVCMRFNQDKVSQARIVFSAAAPIPIRAKAAEAFLVDNVINEQTAFRAGQISVETALSLTGNKYKIRIAQTLVAKALLQAYRNYSKT